MDEQIVWVVCVTRNTPAHSKAKIEEDTASALGTLRYKMINLMCRLFPNALQNLNGAHVIVWWHKKIK